MEDKVYDLITKMYSDFSKKFDDMGKRFDNVENRLDKLENGQQKIEIMIENDIKSKLSALFDGYEQTSERLTVVEDKIDDLRAAVEKQDMEIRVIKGGR